MSTGTPTRFSANDLCRLSAAILEIYRQPDPEGFASTVVSVVAGLLKSDICAYNEIDHAAGEFRPIHDYPGDEPARYYPMFVQHEREFPVGPYAARMGTMTVVKNTDVLSQASFEKTGLYNEFFRKFNVRRLMAGYLRPEWGCQVCVSVHRERRDFSERERGLLTYLLPHIRQASENLVWIGENLRDEEFVEGATPMGAEDRSWLETILLAPDLSTEAVPDRLGRVLKAWFPGWDSRGRRLPEPVRSGVSRQADVAGTMVWTGPLRPWVLGRAFETLTFHLRRRDGGGWELRVLHRCRAAGRSTSDTPPAPSMPGETGGAAPGAPDGTEQTIDLTRREREVLHWLCEGKRNAEIGTILKASPNTIRKHVQRILAKTGTETRSGVVRLAFERRLWTPHTPPRA